MNPWGLDATGLMLWGLIAHLIADWPLQNEWMALNKMLRAKHYKKISSGITQIKTYWWYRHPAAYVHSGIHLVLLAVVFGWPAIFLCWAHLIIDCRWVVEKWSKLIGQTQPQPVGNPLYEAILVDVGTEVRFWTDQVFHIITIAIAALIVGGIS